MKKILNRDYQICRKILSELQDIYEFTHNMNVEEFHKDIKTQKAVTMSLINMSELSSVFSEGFKKDTPEFPSRELYSIRNRAAHKYESLSFSIVWNTIKTDLPSLEQVLLSKIQEFEKNKIPERVSIREKLEDAQRSFQTESKSISKKDEIER